MPSGPRVPLVLLCAPALVSACFPDLPVPAAAQIVCRTGDDCPSGYVCSAASRCARAADLDIVAPRLAGDPVVAPAVGGRDATFTVRFTVSEPLLGEPSVTLLVPSGARPLGRQSQEGNAWTFAYRPACDEGPDPVAIAIRLVDAGGNAAEGLRGGSLRVDCTAPAISAGSDRVEPALARAGTPVSIRFSLAEPHSTTSLPFVSVGAFAEAGLVDSRDGREFSFEFVPRGTEREGDADVAVQLVDSAGNRATAILGTVRLDFTAPALAETPVLPSRPLRYGERLGLPLRFDEPPGEPRVWMSRADGTSVRLEAVPVTELALEFLHLVAVGEDGAWSLEVRDVRDAAGNARAPIRLDGTVEVDGKAPEIQEGPALDAPSFARAGSVLAVEFVTDDGGAEAEVTLGLAQGGVLVFQPAAPEALPTGGTRMRFVHEVAPGDPEGTGFVAISLTDAAQNRGGPWVLGPVTVDRTPPVFHETSVVVSLAGMPLTRGAAVGLGRLLRIAVAADEPLSAARLETGTPHFADDTSLAGKEALFTHLVSASDAAGPLDATIALADLAGNETTLPVPNLVVLDVTVPFATEVAVRVLREPQGEPATGDPLRARRGDRVEVSASASEPLSEVPLLDLVNDSGPEESVPFDESLLPTARPTWSFGADGVSGDVHLILTLADSAGNLSTSVVGRVVYDFEPPQAVAVALEVRRPSGAEYPAAGLGTTLALTLEADEELADATAFFRPATLHWDDSVVQGRRAAWFLRDVSPDDAGGSFGYEVVLRDLAGNETNVEADDAVEVDSSAPVVTGSVEAGPSPARQGVSVAVAFDTSEPMDFAPPAVTLGGAPMTMDAQQSSSTHFVFVRAAQPDGSPDGDRAVVVELADRGGNRTGAQLATVRFDFTAPEVSWASVGYVPGSDNPLASVQSARTGTRIVVTAVPVEPLDASFVPTFDLTCGAARTAQAVEARSRTASGATFDTTVPDGASDGTCVPAIVWRDVAGNTSTGATFASPQIQVKTSRPALAVDQSAVLYLRSPWGNAAPEIVGGIAIPAGPYFALAPPESPGGAETLVPGTFSFAPGTPVRVRLWSDAGKGSLLGTAIPNADGSWPRQRLANLDVPAAWASGVDEAGNESAPVRIDAGEWVATPHAPAWGESPHRIETTTDAGDARAPGASFPAPAGLADGADGAAVLARAGSEWHVRIPSETGPTPRFGHAAAYDAARGRVVLFGGWDRADRQDTWEWDGTRWEDRTPVLSGPSARDGHALAWDGARGRVVLFGGSADDPFDDLWEWDGATWREVLSEGPRPSPRDRHAMAWDAARGRLVMFGGEGPLPDASVWEWDGARWYECPPTGPSPSVRAGHAMAYDETRGRVVLFDGTDAEGDRDDTWEWDGDSWTQCVAAERPGARNEHAMAWDGASGRVVVFGGSDDNGELQDAWEWDGTAWTDAAPPGELPAARSEHAMVWDARDGRVVMFGGWDSTFARREDTWEWTGTAWVDRTPAPHPSIRSGHAVATGMESAPVVLFGGWNGAGFFRDTWSWDGARWSDRTQPTGPTPRQNHAMARDTGRARVVMFGGATTSYRQDTWEFDGENWFDRTPLGASPSARSGHAMAYDPVRERTVMFGGSVLGGGELSSTWEWDGSAWENRTPSDGSGPGKRRGHAMTWDAANGKVLLFAGRTGGELHGDTWHWDGTVWVQVEPQGPSPSAREGPSLAADAHGRLLMFGGDDGSSRNDLWEWDGTRWTERAPSATVPRTRRGHAMALDPARNVMLLFGGAPGPLDDTWELDAAPSRRPAVSFAASFASAGFAPGDVTGLRVRARCGGTYSPFGEGDHGATLLGWASGGPGTPPGTWRELEHDAAGIEPEQLLAPGAAALLDWSAASPAVARRFIAERDREMHFQCRPNGISGTGDARAALDYVEVRVRYRAP